MKHCKQAMKDIGATFSPQDEIEANNKRYIEIAELKRQQRHLERIVKLGMAKDVKACRKTWMVLEDKIKGTL